MPLARDGLGREMTANTADKTIVMFGADWCGDCRRSKALLDAEGIEYDYVDTEAVEDAADRARAISGRTNIPVIVFPDGSHLVEPSNAELRAKLALN
ncbi:NrdH-redoxin [Naasia aerilata]|uniref:NrdH-redoxin n=2 Tax=Naasia aerilata TaxID=1162966 RepID=A0ABM8GFU6_9MICO|nr:NrdH-redoxin [Naasia aerilata]